MTQQWPPKESADFVAAMEDVLEVYQRPDDPLRPQVCLDETSKQLTKEIRTPLPAQPGRPARIDSEYERNGTANLFMMFEPPLALLGVAGGMWKSLSAARRSTSRMSSAIWSMCIIPRPRRSCW